MFLKTILLSLFFFLLACQQSTGNRKDRIVPDSIASADEQNQIQTALSEIQNLATAIGISKNFINFPVVVVSETPAGRKPVAFCHADRDGNGVYIGVLRETLDAIKNEAPFTKNYLFLALVHEFGHCLFNRSHDDAVLSFQNVKIYLTDQAGERHAVENNEIPISAMNGSTPSIMGGPYLSEDIKRYYISEIANLKRWKNIIDLETVEGIGLER